MLKKIVILLFVNFSAFSMQKSEISTQESPDHMQHLIERVIEQLIGQEIPLSVYIKARFSRDHSFRVGEIVAIPTSAQLGTQDENPKYGKIKSINQDEIMVTSLRTQPDAIFLHEFLLQHPALIGKFPENIIIEALNNS